MNLALESLEKSAAALPSWLENYRAPARAAFLSSSWPNRKVEDWRYTSLRSFKEIDFQPSKTQAHVTAEMVQSHTIGADACLVFIDGVLHKDLSLLPPADEQLKVLSIDQAFDTHKEQLASLLKQRLEQQTHNPFISLHQAYSSSGAFITLSPQAQKPYSVEVLFINTAQGQAYCSFPWLVIDQPAHTSLTLYEAHHGIDHGTYLHNSIVDIQLHKHAHLKHYKTQQDSHKAFHIQHVYTHEQAGARYESFHFAQGGQLARTEYQVQLTAPEASVLLDGLYQPSGQQQMDIFSTTQHLAPHCQSAQTYKGILADQSRAVFSGKVQVRHGAKQTNAAQLNKNLLLSERAEAITKPQLEIDDDDVKCSHGATVGQLKPAELFYLCSRGINKADAETILAKAFCVDLVQSISDERFKNHMLHLIGSR